MYLTAASAAWRYSGNVTGPVSRLSRPTVIGEPVALLSVPSAADASCAGVLAALAELSLAALSSSPPHAASNAAAAASVANALVFTGRLLRWGLVMRWPRLRRRGSWSGGDRAGRGGRRRRLRARAGRG